MLYSETEIVTQRQLRTKPEETMNMKVGLFATMLVLSLAFWAPSALAGPLLGWTDVFPFVNEIPRGEAKSRNR